LSISPKRQIARRDPAFDCRRAVEPRWAHRRRPSGCTKCRGAIHSKEVLMADVIVFPLKLRSPETLGIRRRSSLVLFPLRRQTTFVRCVVDEMKALPTQKDRDKRMVAVIGEEFEYLTSISDDVRAIEQDLIAFADEVWVQVTGERHGGAA
jgi:hypothetical protein